MWEKLVLVACLLPSLVWADRTYCSRFNRTGECFILRATARPSRSATPFRLFALNGKEVYGVEAHSNESKRYLDRVDSHHDLIATFRVCPLRVEMPGLPKPVCVETIFQATFKKH